jgi:superfamily II RNA helicase
VANAHAHLQPPKRTASSDSRLETLKRFRVDKHNKKSSSSDCVHNNSVLNNNNSSVQSVSSGINTHHHQQNSYEQQAGQHDSYEAEVENNSIDEQVQSAIDSILNLQQNTPLDLDSILS